ncbi:hypothetical protein, partial [Serratia oryzae]|uniref:hypothetical protein n=1 Tax=Serratia oryzae TaxID=2034155 RepID=UPI001ABF8E81
MGFRDYSFTVAGKSYAAKKKWRQRCVALRQRQLLTQLIQQGKQEEAWKKIRARLLFAPNDVWFIHEAA